MADVFISYSSKDRQVAESLCTQIEQHGYSCWIAPRDILPGEDWARAINTAITAAKVFIVIYSRNSVESSQVPKEIGIAGARDLSIIPYKIDDTPLAGDFEYYLLGCHWVAADPFKGDYKITDVTAAIERTVARNEGRDPSSVVINNNYTGDNNSVINVQQSSSSATALTIAVVAAVSLLIVAIAIIIVLLMGRDKDDNSSSQPDVSQNIVTEEINVDPETKDVTAESTQEASHEPLSYFEAEAIYNEMVYKLIQAASVNSYSTFSACFDDTYTAAEIAEIYNTFSYCVELPMTHISMYEYTDDAIFGMYTFYVNAYDGMPMYYHNDFVDIANVLVRDGDEWSFGRISEDHPLHSTIEQILYPYGPNTDDSYTSFTYQSATATVLCEQFVAELVNVSRNEDGTVTVRFQIINGDYGFPSELTLSMSVYDFNSNVLLCLNDMPMSTNIAAGEIHLIEMTTEPIEYIDDVDLTACYYDSYVHATFG